MAELPDFLREESEDEIMKRMLAALPDDLDKSEGSYIWDALYPFAIELARAKEMANEVLRLSFASESYGEYLDKRVAEHGLTRRPAVKAKGTVRFQGQAGTVIPAGTRVATPAGEDEESVEFVTTADVTLDSSGTTVAPVEAVEAGAQGNVPAGAISVLVDHVTGVASVTNDAPTSGGLDVEDDESLRARYFQRVSSPSAGGNKADYANWALEVPGVGGVAVIPVEDGPGTVSIYVIDQNKEPAGQALIDAVQDAIAPPYRITEEQDALVLDGYGVSVEALSGATDGQAVRMAYDPAGPGTVTRPDLHTLLPQPGIWQVRPRLMAEDTSATDELLEVGVWNVSTNSWARRSPSSTEEARVVLRAADLPAALEEWVAIEAYWNGVDQLELRATRLGIDTSTVVWLDSITYRSTFSRIDGTGRAPIGARVTVKPARSVLINVSARLTISPGYNPDSVRAAVVQRLRDYIRSLAFADNNDVLYSRIGLTILETPGVIDYADLILNGGTSNVPIAANEVAVLGTVTLT